MYAQASHGLNARRNARRRITGNYRSYRRNFAVKGLLHGKRNVDQDPEEEQS